MITDKDKLLPLVDFLAIGAAVDNGPDIVLKVAEAQREADWKRIQCLIGAVL